MQAQQKKQQFLEFIYAHPAYTKSIKPALQDMAQKVYKLPQLVQKLKQFSSFLMYTRRDLPFFHKKQANSYAQLKRQYGQQLPNLFSDMAALILEYENKVPKIPIMYAQVQVEYSFTKKQILLVMSLMALSLIPNQQCRFHHKLPLVTDFGYMFSHEDFKTTAIMQYFSTQFQQLKKHGADYENQNLTLKRIVQLRKIEDIMEQNRDKPMILPTIAHDKQSIEEYFGQTKVDFANKYIGGGALASGCVQQEIMFANHPQMFTSVLFCEVMSQNEAIQFVGYKKYFKNLGYGHTTSFAGEQQHQYEYDDKCRAKEYIVAIDALHYPSKRHQSQFSLQIINRQVLKAYAGFSKASPQNGRIVTGNWGCGAFNGNIPLKFLIQWLACSASGKQMVYTPFGYRDKLTNFQVYIDIVSTLNVGQAYQLIVDSQKQLYESRDLFKTISPKLEQ